MMPAIGLFLLLLSWLQPLHVLPWLSWHNEVLAFAASAALLLSYYIKNSDKSSSSRVAFPVIAVVIAMLAPVALLQFCAGLISYFGDALVFVIYAANVSFLLALGLAWSRAGQTGKSVVTEWSSLGLLALTVCIGSMLSVFVALAQSLQVWGSMDWVLRQDYYHRPGANMGQPNHLATLALMGIASTVFLFRNRRISGQLATLLACVLILGVVISESRTGLMAATVLVMWWTWRPIRERMTTWVWGAWFGLVVMAAMWPGLIDYIQQGGLSALDLGTGVSRTPALRFRIWPQLLEAAMLRPWFGWGLRGVSAAQNAVLDQYSSGEPYTYAHNLLLDLVIGVGIPGGILLFVLLVIWAFRHVRLAGASEASYCVALCIPFVCHSLLEFPHTYAYFLFPIALAMGYLAGEVAPDSSIWIPGRWVQALGIGVVVTMLSTLVEYVYIEEDFRVARMEALRVGKTPDDYLRPTIHLLTQLDAMLVATRTQPAPSMTTQEIEQLRLAAMRFPWTAIQNRYALSLALNGNPAEAVRQLRVMRAMFGEKFYAGIRRSWLDLAETKYPQLANLQLP